MKIYRFLKKYKKNIIIKFLKLNLKLNYFKSFLIILKNFLNKIDKINFKIYYLYSKYIIKINIL